MARRILNYFASGLLLVGPIYLTLWIIMTAVQTLDNLLPVYLDIWGNDKPVYFPGLGLLVIVSLIVLLGYIFSTVVPQSFRSEEHTSELQSRENLVCRLLLE